MPIYPIICKSFRCGHQGDVLAPSSQASKLRCPECGGPAEQNFAAKNIGNGNREFHGQTRTSLAEWYHPTEVAEARRELGKSGECVQADGKVKFKDRAQQQQYLRDKQAMVDRFQLHNAVKRERRKRLGIDQMPKHKRATANR